jgi:hypothetical protein
MRPDRHRTPWLFGTKRGEGHFDEQSGQATGWDFNMATIYDATARRHQHYTSIRSMICARNARATRRPWSELGNYWVTRTRESQNASIAGMQR